MSWQKSVQAAALPVLLESWYGFAPFSSRAIRILQIMFNLLPVNMLLQIHVVGVSALSSLLEASFS